MRHRRFLFGAIFGMLSVALVVMALRAGCPPWILLVLGALLFMLAERVAHKLAID